MKKIDKMFLVLIISLLMSAPAIATQYTEGFEYHTPDSNTFTSGIFQHNIVPMPPVDYTSWDISTFGSPPSGNALDLWPAIDEVTFDLNQGEYIDYASIQLSDYSNGTTFEVTGSLGTYTLTIPFNGGSWEFADTTGQNIGNITMVRLMSYEGMFDNLTVNVLPEPSTVLLLSMGSLAVLRKRRV